MNDRAVPIARHGNRESREDGILDETTSQLKAEGQLILNERQDVVAEKLHPKPESLCGHIPPLTCTIQGTKTTTFFELGLG